jgi:hypothetical protein
LRRKTTPVVLLNSSGEIMPALLTKPGRAERLKP